MCIAMAIGVRETPHWGDRDQTLVSEIVLDENLVAESATGQTLGGDELALDQTPSGEQILDQIMDKKFDRQFEWGCDELPSSSGFKLIGSTKEEEALTKDVPDSALYETLVASLVQGHTLVVETAIDETVGEDEPALDQTLIGKQILDQIDDEELGPGLEQDCNESSPSLGFKSIGSAEEEEALAEDKLEMPGEIDDLGYNDLDCYRMNGMPPYVWPLMRAYQFGPQCSPREMWYRRRGLGYHLYGPCGWDHWCSPNGKEKKQEGDRFSLSQSELGKVNPAMVGAGLYNLGNTCFLNVILQCFTHTVPLIEGLRSYNHPKPCESDIDGFCVFCAVHKHIELAISSNGKSLSPLQIVENLNQLSSDFRRYQQEDAHELLQCLLDKLDRCCSGLEMDDSRGQSLVHQLFGGRLVSKLQCCNCGHCSDTFEPLIDLSLEIENVSSLPSALESFTKVERIEDDEPQFTCESCKEKVAIEKQLMVDHAPSIAAFHLKRFKNDGYRVAKIDKHVQFPLELDLKPYCQNDNVDLQYNLYAIVVHAGFSPTSGHYFSFIRSAPDAWYRLDDNQVTGVSESHVLSHEAYILFYAKNGMPWFTTFMETQKLHMESIVTSSSPKSVLETVNPSSELSPTRETNIISKLGEEDRRDAMGIPGLSLESSTHKGLGEAKNDPKIEKSSPSPLKVGNLVISSTSPNSNLGMDQISESSPTMETNIGTDVNEVNRRDVLEISRLSFNNCRYKDEVDEAKGDFDCVKMSSLLVVSNASTKSVIDNTNHTSKSSETNTSSDVNEGDRRDTMEISRLPSGDSECKERLNEAKDDSKIQSKLCASVPRGDNNNQSDVESTKSADFDSSTFQILLSPISISKLSFDDCSLDDRVDAAKDDSEVEKKFSPYALKGEVGKSVAINSSTFSGLVFSAKPSIPKDHLVTERKLPCKRQFSNDRQKKEAYKLLKGMSCSRRRSQLMAAVNSNREVCLKGKRSTVNELPSNMKDGPSNALHNPNLVSLMCSVTPRKF